MNDLNNEYFVLYPDSNQNYPMLRTSLTPDSLRPIDEDNYELMIYKHTIMPNKPVYVDYHTSGGIPVISPKFVEALKELNIYGIQTLKGTKGDVIEDLKLEYYLLHVHNHIISMDMKKSKYTFNDRIQSVTDVEKFTLDSEKLFKIPVEKRLIFAMEEHSVYNIFHQSVVDHLSNFDLKGMRFIPVTSWNDNAHFN
jgi:hypothetical protein